MIRLYLTLNYCFSQLEKIEGKGCPRMFVHNERYF